MWGSVVKTERIYDTKTGEWDYKGKRPQSIELLEKSGMPFTGPYKVRDHAIETERLRIDFNSVSAYSYAWWCFMKLSKDGKTLYFNDTYYSRATSQHQQMLNNVLKIENPKAFGIKVKKVWGLKEGLNNLDEAIENKIQQYAEAVVLAENSRKYHKVHVKYAKRCLEYITEFQAMQKDLGYKITRVKKSELDEAVANKTFDRLDELEYKRERAAKKRAAWREANKETIRKEFIKKLIEQESKNETA